MTPTLSWLYNISINKSYGVFGGYIQDKLPYCMLNTNKSDSIWQKSALKPLSLSHQTPAGLRSKAFSWPKTLLACTHCTTLQYTYIIGPVSEMCIIPTFLVTRPIHISKAGLWQSAFVKGDAAIRQASILKEQLAGAVMHCWFVGLMWGSSWDMLILIVWERLECLDTIGNKVSCGFAIPVDIYAIVYPYSQKNSTIWAKSVTVLPFQL